MVVAVVERFKDESMYGLPAGTKKNWSLCSLRSKRFRLVPQQRKTEERDSRFWPREK